MMTEKVSTMMSWLKATLTDDKIQLEDEIEIDGEIRAESGVKHKT